MRSAFLSVWVLLTCFIFPCDGVNPRPRLLIKMATRSRYEQFFRTLDQYYAQLSQRIPYHFVISCDVDDPVMNSPEARAKFQTYPHLSVYYGDNKSKIEACNADIDKHPDFDLLILASDDMVPVVRGFDRMIVALNASHFPNYDGVLHFNDGHQGQNLNTLPIMGKKYYDFFGYVYYPEYKSFYCDSEMTHVSLILNKVVYSNKIIIEHCHPDTGKAASDELYRINFKFWDQDEALYRSRRLNNFGLKAEDIQRFLRGS